MESGSEAGTLPVRIWQKNGLLRKFRLGARKMTPGRSRATPTMPPIVAAIHAVIPQLFLAKKPGGFEVGQPRVADHGPSHFRPARRASPPPRPRMGGAMVGLGPRGCPTSNPPIVFAKRSWEISAITMSIANFEPRRLATSPEA